MKKNTLELIRDSLITEQPEVRVPEPILSRAALAFERMFGVTDESPNVSAPVHAEESSLAHVS